MLKKCLILCASSALMAGAAMMSSSADRGAKPVGKYQLVADWPKLPAGVKLGGVTAVAVDSDDRVHIFQRGKQPIMVFDKDGKFLRSWGDGLVKTAHGLRIDPSGNVWITDIGNHLVTKFDRDGKVLMTLGKKNKPGDGTDQFNKPTDVAVSAAGDIFVADGYGNARVVKFTREGKFLKTWGKKGKGPGEFDLPHAICLNAQGQVCVGDRENGRVQFFDADGTFLTQWQESGAPYGLWSAQGLMFVADGVRGQVNVLNATGKVQTHCGEKGAGPGQFAMPHGVAVDSSGAIYVAEVDGKRVQKFVAK